jgi:membrane-bound lytic murein transglycosylase B
MPPGPPDSPQFLTTPEPLLRGTGDPKVDAYMQRVLRDGGAGWRPYLVRAFAGVRANQAVIDDFPRRPGGTGAYLDRYLTAERIARGQQLYRELSGRKLFEGEQKVPLEVLLAVWGAHSDYGASPPPFDAIEALVNLGACGKGPGWTTFAVYEAVTILASNEVERSKLRAYGDGRLGESRLFPDQYLRWADDGDGDGRRDVWTSRADILRNIQRKGLLDWEASLTLIAEIEPVPYDPAVPNDVRRVRGSIGWAGAHRRVDGKPWPASAEDSYGWQPLQPAGRQGPNYLVSRNFRMLGFQSPYLDYYWSQPDEDYALAIAFLAERIAGRPGPSRPIR